jgi:hypothetical protein
MGLFTTSKKEQSSLTSEGDAYKKALKKHSPWANVKAPRFKTAKEKEATRRLEVQKNRRQTELYRSRADVKRAKRAASHPYEKDSTKLSDLRRRAGKSGKMRIF